MIGAGELRSVKVNIHSPTLAQDAMGQQTITWSTIAELVPVQLLGVGGGEVFRGRQIQSGVDSVIRMRYRAGLTTQMRFKYGNRYLYIDRILNACGMNRLLEIHCREAST